MPGGENALIEWFRERFAVDSSRVVIGIGDDMAGVRTSSHLITLTTDMLLDGVHFDTTRHPLALIGRKAVACSLSDCAAMACRPHVATVSVALAQTMTLDDARQLGEGMAAIAEDFSCPIVGGDTTSWAGRLAIDVAMLAEPATSSGPVLRSGARPGDVVYVSGPLGGSILGKHLTFTPRVELASRLAGTGHLHAMMDISDGLGMDLHRLCKASDCAAELSAEWLEEAVSDPARILSLQDGQSPLDHALGDGEDFELLITAADGLAADFPELIALGRITARDPDQEQPRIVMTRQDGQSIPLPPRGYEHFR